MPPKKGPATTKAKAVKKKVEKENPEVVEQDEEVVPVKKAKLTKAKPAPKVKAQKEKSSDKDSVKEVPQKKKKAATAATAAKQGKTKAATDDPPAESENGTTKKKATKSKKAQSEKSETNAEVPGTSKVTATRGKRAKKENIEAAAGDSEEEPVEVVKAPAKRGPRKNAKKNDNKETETEVKAPPRTNTTVTQWDAIDFTCASKTPTGKTSNFHITSWNVDGLRAWLKKGGLDILKFAQPDILCLQETKCSVEKLPEEIKDVEGYETFWCSSDKEGYAGVGVLSKVKPLNVIYGINSDEHDDEGRCITAEYKDFFLVNVYVPNAGRKLVTLPKRLEWNESFKAFIKKLDESKPVILCGDMNVAHTEIDLANPKTNTKNAGFTVEEREGMTDFLQDGYVDSFRQLYPEKEKAYTFWTYMAGARAKNVGWRLDYFIVSERFMDSVCDNVIHSEVFGSDHCPLSLYVNV